MEIASIVCPTKAAVQEVRAVLIRYGVRMNLVKEEGPFMNVPPDPTIYLIINYALSEQQTTQIRVALSHIAGVTTQP